MRKGIMQKIKQLWEHWKVWRAEEKARRWRLKRAATLSRVITHELGRLGFKRESKKKGKSVVEWKSPLLLTPEELWLRLDQARLPEGKTTDDLRAPGVIKSLCDRTHVDVRIDNLPNREIAVVCRLVGDTFPAIFPINKFELPNNAPSLAFPLGVDAKGNHCWADLARLPHLLVVGPTGKGKSTLIHAMLTTWISRNTPEDLELWLADHKGGVELERYRALLPNKQQAGIVRRFSYKPVDTIALLEAGLKELERRLDVLREAGAVDVDDYARTTGRPMRRIVILIDEIFFLMLNKEKIDPNVGKAGKGFSIAAWAEQLFSKIASAGRAPGVHLVIATQKTGKEVLTQLITANFESRAVFGVADMYQSIYLVGSAKAQNLPKGRVLFKHEGGELDEVQTPWISPSQTKLIISRISRYGPDGGLGAGDEAKRFREDAKLLLTVSCDLLGGSFSLRELFRAEGVRGVLTKDRIEEIGRRLEKDGVLMAGGPRKPRRVAPGFYNRADLIDALYDPDRPVRALEKRGQEQDDQEKGQADPRDLETSEQQQDAPDQADELNPDTSDDLSLEGGEDLQTDDIEPPAWFVKSFETDRQNKPRKIIVSDRFRRRPR